MANGKKKITQKRENRENKRPNKYKKGLSQKRFNKKFFELILVIIFYNFIALTEEKPIEERILENINSIKIIINGEDTSRIFGDDLFLQWEDKNYSIIWVNFILLL